MNDLQALYHRIEELSIRATMTTNPKMFAWLGDSERRKIDFEDGYNYAIRDVMLLINKMSIIPEEAEEKAST